jgi:carboxymethylenebutenolidase
MPKDHVTLLPAANPRRGGVVLLQEAFGVTDYLLSVGANLAAAGWTTAIPHLYHRSGSPTFAYEVDEGDGVDDRQPAAERAASRAIGPHAMRLTAEGVAEDIDDCLAALEGDGIEPANVGAVGFCFGGSVALYLSARSSLGASVVFYGAGIRDEHFGVPAFAALATERCTPLLGHYGMQDRWIDQQDVDLLESELSLGAAPYELIRYPGAGHGFHCDRRGTYHAPSASAAWARTLTWLDVYAGRGR